MLQSPTRWLASIVLLAGMMVSGCAHLPRETTAGDEFITAAEVSPSAQTKSSRRNRSEPVNSAPVSPAAFAADNDQDENTPNNGPNSLEPPAPQIPDGNPESDESPATPNGDDEPLGPATTPAEDGVIDTGEQVDPAATPEEVDVTETGDQISPAVGPRSVGVTDAAGTSDTKGVPRPWPIWIPQD